MAPHVDILDEAEPLKGPLTGSIVLHILVALAVTLLSVEARREHWGDPNPGGGSAMVVNVVGQVPLPSHGGPVNPVANDTKSEVPEPKPDKVKQAKVAEPEPEAIPLPSRAQPKKPSRKESSLNTYRMKQVDRANQLFSQEGQALSSPMVGMAGSGGVGVGQGSPFGDRFGWYVDMLKQRVAQKWRTGDVDPRIRSAPPAIVTFVIRRDGSISNVRVEQTSGNMALDLSAQRAIDDASPFPPLPAGFDKNDVSIEFWFQLKR
jgi:periplasmic protein TonB